MEHINPTPVVDTDPRLEKIEKFYDDWKEKHNGDMSELMGHNIYLLQTEDRDGNITGEAYALNVTTDRYYRKCCVDANYDLTMNYLFIGNGDPSQSTITSESSQLISCQYGTAMTRTSDDQTRIDGGSFTYDSNTGLLRATAWIMTGYFDYVLSGVSSDLTITEIGMSESNDRNALASHAWVYVDGHLGSITKHTNEKLTITAYIAIYHKPGYIEDKLWRDGYGFTWNPWGAFFFGRPGVPYNWSSHYNGTINALTTSFICAPRWMDDNNRTYYETNQNYPAMKFKQSGSYYENFWGGTYDAETKIVTINRTATKNYSTLLEHTNRYYDLMITNGEAEYSSSYGAVYTTPMSIIKEISLDTPEELTCNCVYTRKISDGDLSGSFGENVNSSYDGRSVLPVTKMKISSVKSYNGLTHDWDIDEVVSHGMDNDVNVTMTVLYPWGSMRINNVPYMDSGVLKYGTHHVAIYCNLLDDPPISSINTTYISAGNIWATDTYWDPSSYERITDPANVPATLGAKRYILGYVGTPGAPGTSISTRPVQVSRAGFVRPEMQIDPVIELDAIDTPDNGGMGGTRNNAPYFTKSYNYVQLHLANDAMGYVWMNDHLYYPELDVSWRIDTSEPVGNVHEPIYSLRFGEPSGHRILQFFRASNFDNYNYICYSKISVFDIPSATEVQADPTLTPTETVFTTDISNNVYYYGGVRAPYVSTTETGYVVVGHMAGNKTYIFNLLGDAESNYQPTMKLLKYPGTDDIIQTGFCFAIKYTSYVIFVDPNTSTSSERGFTIIDLATDTIVDQFTVERAVWASIEALVGWNNLIYITGYKSSFDGDWRCYLYDLNKPSGSRLIDTGWSSTNARAICPGGDYTDWNKYVWVRACNPHIMGDQKGLVFTYTNVGDDNGVGLYYITEDRPTEIINFNSIGLTGRYLNHYQENGYRPMINIYTFNDSKQRIMAFDTGNRLYYQSYNNYWNANYKSWYFDANQIHDFRKGPSRGNATAYAIPYSISVSESNSAYVPIRTSCMYKGKMFISEYSCNYSWRSMSGYSLYYLLPANKHRFVDPNTLIPHQMTGTTTTIQAYNNPKRIYGIERVSVKMINSSTIWDPDDMPPGE